MGFFDIFLPTFDVYGDASLILSWFTRGHPVYGALMCVPMAFNYVFTSYKWWSMEKKKESRKWSWVLVLFQLWQQWNALKVMIKLSKKDDRAEEKKKRMLREVSSIEPFFESVPSILIMTCIWLHAGGLGVESYYYNVDCSNTASLRDNQKNFCAVFDGLGGPAWFFTTYAVSIFAGSLGICKFLQNGPVAILPTNLVNWTLVRAFFAVMFALLAKGLFAGILVGLANSGVTGYIHGKSTQIWLFPLIFIAINILPNLILSVLGISLKTGWNKTLIKALLDYPAYLVLPTFTNFCAGPPQLTCSKSKNSEKELTVSGKLTAINTVLTVLCYAISIGILSQHMRPHYSTTYLSLNFAAIFSPVLITSCLCILLFYRFKLYCCKCCIKCCCSCCCKESCFETRIDVIDKETVS